ncbi:MAG: phenylacetate-CoA oxygenase subunit PaaI [Thermoplasmata archaeon]|nr:phenylacetate-CoA oxygenase subunit PaaI [Thermoplasmata archaeon]MCI4338146.1 phenylacetate-CoA oxygenase subunit PaaI [Thermoplasmata archaeon]MCI4340791.1 phenylacetate-CoA oxygenase subunit PaaI [Thermoplasmata archaeon]
MPSESLPSAPSTGAVSAPTSQILKEGGTIEPVREILWGEMAGVRKYESAEEIPAEMRRLIIRLMVVQADTEFASIQQHRPWLDSAPSLEDRWIEARIVADEARHGLQACRILRDFGEEGQKYIDELLTKKEGEHKLDAFNMKFERWSDVGAFTCFVDRVGVYQLRAFQECAYGPLARAMPLMLSEEQLHLNFGLNVLRRMVQQGPKYAGSKEEAQEAVQKWFPRALDMFGHSNSDTSRKAIELGLKRWTNEEARARYLKEIAPLISAIGLELPAPEYDRHIL